MGDILSVASIIENHPFLLDDRDIHSRTPLHYVAEVGALEVLEYVINKYTAMKTKDELENYLNSTSSKGETALMLAASQGHHEAVGLLIKKGVNIDVIADNGQTALDNAAEGGYQWIAGNLIRNNADTKISKVYCQIQLRNKRNLQQEAVGKPKQQKFPIRDQPEEEHRTPLMMAAINGDVETTKMLLDSGVDIEESSRDGETALMLAASKGEREVIRMLLSSGANIDATNSKGWTILMLVVRQRDEKTVDLLLSNGADVNHLSPDRWTALAEATLQSQTSMISLLLRRGADTESKSSHDWVPLMHAAYKGDEEAVTLLLDAGAKLDVSSLHDETAILLAAAGCHTKIAQMLLKADCAPEPAWAVAKPSGEHKKFDETERKAHDNATLGWTPLMLACQNGLGEVVRMLLQKNVNLDPKSPYRKTALVIARENGKTEIATLLEDYANR
jgi:ankyrin repeat protein